MTELDRRIAVEIMGEPQPTWRRPETPTLVYVPETSEAWWRGSWNHDWTPHPFSSNLEYAMKAVDKVRGNEMSNLGLTYLPDRTWKAGGLGSVHTQRGGTAPKAICNLLLALTEPGEE